MDVSKSNHIIVGINKYKFNPVGIIRKLRTGWDEDEKDSTKKKEPTKTGNK